MTKKPDGYQCTYCGNILKRESAFLRHRCKDKIRDEQLRSVRGQAAFQAYSYWLKKNKHVTVTIKTFSQSKMFSCFYNFVGWCKKVKIPNRNQYIRYMIIKKYPPVMWTDNAVYIQFLDWIDYKWTADDHFRYTYKTLKKIAIAADCDISEALSFLHPNEVLVYVRSRKLSPWVLLKMNSFKQLFKSLSKEQRIHFEQVIRPIHWSKILKDPAKSEDNELIKSAVKELNL